MVFILNTGQVSQIQDLTLTKSRQHQESSWPQKLKAIWHTPYAYKSSKFADD